MDYHRYSSIGVGSMPSHMTGPPSLGGNGMSDHIAQPGAAPPLPSVSGAPSSLLPHHPSVMFHYGVGSKSHNVQAHLLSSSPTAVAVANCLSNCNTGSIMSSSNCGSAMLSSKACGSGVGRTPATIPPLGLVSPLPPLITTTAGGALARASSPNSSFAAALRSLAKQATGPSGSDVESSHIEPTESKRQSQPQPPLSSSSSSVVSTSVAVGPPVFTIAPTHTTHLTLLDMRKPAEGAFSELDQRMAPEDMLRGFQPYRAPDLPPNVSMASTSSGQAPLRPALPMDLAHAYQPYPSLYSHHLTHQYRLEEQLYLERYGLLRAPLPPYGVGGLSALYPSAAAAASSPFVAAAAAAAAAAARFPPELLPTSLAVLHPSPALLHERLKLEEDIRQREYELELRREREHERERERERERGREREREKEKEREREREREREKERDRRHKEQENEKNKEEHLKAVENMRDRSPLSHSVSGIWNSSTSSNSSTLNVSGAFGKKGQPVGTATQQAARPLDVRSSKHPNDFIMNTSSNQILKSHDSSVMKFESNSSRYNGGMKHRTPAIVRPFESTPNTAPIGISLGTVPSSSKEEKNETKSISNESAPLTDDSKPFSVWQPVQLSVSNSGTEIATSNRSRPHTHPIILNTTPALSISQSSCESLTDNHLKSYAIQSTPNSISQTSQISKCVQSNPTSLPVQLSDCPPFFSQNFHPPYSSQVTQTTQVLIPSQPYTSNSYLHPPLHSVTASAVSHMHPVTQAQSFLFSVPHRISASTQSHPPLTSCEFPLFIHSQVAEVEPLPQNSSAQPSTETSPVLRLPTTSIPCVSFSTVEKSSVVCPLKPFIPLSEASVVAEKSESHTDDCTARPAPTEKVATPFSRLDAEEQRLRELRATGMLSAEAEETLLEEALTPTKTPRIICIKGPPNPLEASTEKLSFLCSFGLTTHDKADEVELDRSERRAKVLIPLSADTTKDPPTSSLTGWLSAGRLAPLLAPGQSLSDTYKMKRSSLLVDFSNKSRFLHHLDLQPQHSLTKQKEVERIWKLIIEERLRRYCLDDSNDPLALKICDALRKLLDIQLPTINSSPLQESPKDAKNVSISDCSPPTPPTSPMASGISTTRKYFPLAWSSPHPPPLLPLPPPLLYPAPLSPPPPPPPPPPPLSPRLSFSSSSASTTVATSPSSATTSLSTSVSNSTTNTNISSSAWTFPLSNSSVTSNSKAESTLLKVGVKGMVEDGPFGVSNYFPSDHDPLLAGLSTFDKVIDHFVQNAEAKGGNNSVLLKHIEEVRLCQVSVCQTAQVVQEQVAKLISSRAELESNRAALHHHLASITSILASKNNHKTSTAAPPPRTSHSERCPVVCLSTRNSISAPVTLTSLATPNIDLSNALVSPSSCSISSLPSLHPPVYSTSTIQSSHQISPSRATAFSNLPQQQFSAKCSVANSLAIPALVSTTTKISQSILPAATLMSWAGLPSPFITSTNIPLSLETKEATHYPHLASRDFKDIKNQSGASNSQLNLTSKILPNATSTTSVSLPKLQSNSRYHGSNKSVPSKAQTTTLQGQPSNKFNGSAATFPQHNIFKPLQLNNTSATNSSTNSNNNFKILTNSSFQTVLGGVLGAPHSSQASQLNLVSSAGSVPASSNSFAPSKGAPLPPAASSSSSSSTKPARTNKSPVGFAPYSKSSPNKVQTWLPN